MASIFKESNEETADDLYNKSLIYLLNAYDHATKK